MQEVKDFIKRFFRTPILLVFFLICVILLPTSINLRSISFRTGVVVALGIDINENDEFVLDAIITIPSITDNLTENDKIITAKGISVIDALSNMNILLGKAIRLGHTRFIIIGQSISQKNVANAIDGLIRTNKVRDSVQLLMCESSVHDMLNVGMELKIKTGLNLSEIICHLEEYSTTSLDSNVDSFYKGYFSQSKISKLNSIELTSDHLLGITPTPDAKEGKGGQTAGANTGQSNLSVSNNNKYVSNTGKLAIFKDGKLAHILSSEMALASGWINVSYLPKKLIAEVSDVSNVLKICYEVLQKSVKNESFFINGIPILYYKVNLTIDINEIISNTPDVVPKNNNLIWQTEMKNDINIEIKKQLSDVFNFAKENKIDIFGFNDIFYLNQYDKYNKYLENKTPDDFLEDVQLNVDVNVKII